MRLLSSSCFKENADKQESMQLFPIAWFLFIEIVDLNLVFPTQNCPDGSCGLLCSSYALLLLFSSPNSCNLYMRTHQVSITHVHVDTSRPSCSQRDFSCAERVRGQSVTEGGLWAVLNRAGCHHLVPGLCLLAALGMVGCVCACVCVWVGICLGVCHPSGDEQLFYHQVQRVSPTWTHSPAGKKRKKKRLPTFTERMGSSQII